MRALARFGVTVVESRGGSSHYKATKPGYRAYSLPLHNGARTELPEVYVRSVCNAFDIDEDELRKLL